MQAYVLRDRQLTVELLDRARQAGAKAVVLTPDTPVVGQKYRTGPVRMGDRPAGTPPGQHRPTRSGSSAVGEGGRPDSATAAHRAHRGAGPMPWPWQAHRISPPSPATSSPVEHQRPAARTS
ncbi:hypothetical protein GZL_08935 [Streptomyces sp. 769]|nr:hypothetical protein GZL_08935 [Streptomyces sp. 769]